MREMMERKEGGNQPDKQENGSKTFLVAKFQMHLDMKVYLGNKVTRSRILSSEAFEPAASNVVLFLISEAPESACGPNYFW